MGTLALGLAAIALAALIAFLIRQRRAANPLYDLKVAGRRVFWVAATAGVIVFGTLMGAMFIGQQFQQNVLGYSTFEAGLSIVPAAACMVVVAPRSAKLVEARRGSRCSPATSSVSSASSPCCCSGTRASPTGASVSPTRWSGRCGSPNASLALTHRLRAGAAGRDGLGDGGPAARSGRRDHAVDPRRAADRRLCGGCRRGDRLARQGEGHRRGRSPAHEVFAGAEEIAEQNPQYASQITAAAKESFLDGADWAYTAGIVAILLGAALVFLRFLAGRKNSGCSRSTTPRTPDRPLRVPGGARTRRPARGRRRCRRRASHVLRGEREVLDGYGVDECTSGRGQVLIPWPNRIEDGTYEFDGERHQLPLTEPEHRNAIHGLVRGEPWTVAEQEGSRVLMTYALEPQPGYPFSLALELEYSLTGDGLRVQTTATNVGGKAAPHGSGAHPYLRAGSATVDSATLRIPARTVLHSNDRGLPVGSEQVEGSEFDFRSPRPIGATVLDHAFTDLERATTGSRGSSSRIGSHSGSTTPTRT